MSELTLTEPEVLTDHTKVICSTSIERIVTGRNSALKQIERLIQQVADISTLTRSIAGKTALGHEAGFSLWLLADGETRGGNESHNQ